MFEKIFATIFVSLYLWVLYQGVLMIIVAYLNGSHIVKYSINALGITITITIIGLIGCFLNKNCR